MIRVSIDGSVYGPNPGGGIGRYFTETLLRLALEPGLDIRCVLPPDCCPPARGQGGLRFVNRHRSNRIRDAWQTRAWQGRIFHASYYTAPPRPGLPYLVTVYDFVDRKIPAALANPSGFFELQCRLIRQAEAVLTISHSTRDDIVAHTGIPADRITVKPNSAPVSFMALIAPSGSPTRWA